MKFLYIIIFSLMPILGYAKMEVREDVNGNPILEQFSEEGFVDSVFKIKNLVETNKDYKFHLSASHKGEILGFDVTIIKGIKGGFDSNMNLITGHVYKHGVVFSRSGVESDRLISVLNSLYGYKQKKIKMVQKEIFTAIALHQNPIDITSEAIKIKIFGKDSEPIDEDAYYESFFNIDFKNGFVFWNEKDADYRKQLISGLSE
jgi:hypothetical protein